MSVQSALPPQSYQTSIPGFGPVDDAAFTAARRNATIDERGAIYTRKEVVEFILDLAGYNPDRPLHTMRLLEPSFGDGDFLLPAIKRLITAWRRCSGDMNNVEDALSGAIAAVELHQTTWEVTSQKVINYLMDEGFTTTQAGRLVRNWLINDDFLLTSAFKEGFQFVVGNPPYVRQELVPVSLMAEYRKRYTTIYDRADLYIPFIERSLSLLKEDGHLGFICSDRWMKNKYGGPLRGLIANHFHLKFHVDMVDTEAFQKDVIAYPAITVLRRGKGHKTRIAYRPQINQEDLSLLASLLNNGGDLTSESKIRELENATAGTEPWILEFPDRLNIVRKLESKFPLIEEVGCRVGIGVATGADKIFVAPFKDLDVEEDRKLPLVMTRDIEDGHISWRGNAVLNPFEEDGTLARLDKYPRFSAYLEQHKETIARRHVSAKNPGSWYRTIDRIYPSLTLKPKLLIPDIKGQAHIVFDKGEYYPHHNLYFITSETWHLQALQAVLTSGIAHLFVSTYSTQMRGGYLRFQAQYLRRIRLPRWESLPQNIKEQLIKAGEERNEAAAAELTYEVYGLTPAEIQIMNNEFKLCP